jgi:TetR/AcrR family transcriptional regulator
MKPRAKNGTDSREKIIQAALGIFAERGKHGARMEEIAAKAEVNKAMVYYYYSTKDALFQAVLVTILEKIYGRVSDVLDADRDGGAGPEGSHPVDKVVRLLDAHLTVFSEDIRFAKIFLQALGNEPQDLKAAIHDIRGRDETSGPHLTKALLSAIEDGIRRKKFRELDASHVLISIIGMSLISFIDKSIAETLLNQKIENGETFLRERSQSTIDLVLHGVMGKPRSSPKGGTPRSGDNTSRKRER